MPGGGSDFQGPLWNGKPTPAYRPRGRHGCGPHRPVAVLGERKKGDSGGNLRQDRRTVAASVSDESAVVHLMYSLN